MPIYDNNGTTSAEIGKLYDNNGTTSAQIGKVYDNNGTTSSLIYSAEEILVKDSALQSGVTFTMVATTSNSGTTEGVVQNVITYGGAYFGKNVSMLNTDIRSFDTINYTFTRSGGTSQTGYCPMDMVIGTETQIKGITYTAYNTYNINGCTSVVAEYNQNKTYTGTYTIPGSIKSASSPIYIGWLLGGYNGIRCAITLNNIVLE